MKKLENPSAFPFHDENEGGVRGRTHLGMTLRDWFAGQALANDLTQGEPAINAAFYAYQIADAMLAERAKED